jgi:hypothetical protein
MDVSVVALFQQSDGLHTAVNRVNSRTQPAIKVPHTTNSLASWSLPHHR